MEGSRHLKSFRDGVKSVIDGKNGEEMRSCGTLDSPEFHFFTIFIPAMFNSGIKC